MRIEGVTIPNDKHLDVALTVLHGVGRSRAQQALAASDIPFETHANDLSTDDESKLRQALEEFTLEGNLRREVGGNIKRLKDIDSYRGMRHSRNLPARGQRTKTNSRTVRGNVRKTMGSGKRKVEKK